MEAILAKRTLSEKTLESTTAVFKELSPLKEAFPILCRLVQIVLTICGSTVSCETSLYALKRLTCGPLCMRRDLST